MINTKTIYNLITQDLIKKYNIPGDNKVLSLTATNKNKMRLFKYHHIIIKAYRHDGLWTSDGITILSANIISYKLILGIPWIKKTKLAFDWDKNRISFAKRPMLPQELILQSKQENKWAISALYLLNSFKSAVHSKSSNITLMGLEKFHLIYKTKGIQV